MTAIAAFKVNTVPVIIGDIMLSTEGDQGLSIVLPGSGENAKNFADARNIAFYPAKLSQKVTIISENLIIATAGSLKVSIDFVKYLKNDIKLNTEPTWEYTQQIFNNFDYDETRYEFAFVCYYHNKDEGISAITGFNAEKREVEGFEGLIVAGSGKEALIESISNVSYQYSQEDLPSGIKAAHKVNSLISNLWSLDITNQKSIENAFGGGYEIGTLKNNKLVKIGDILLFEIFVTGTSEKMLLGFNTRISKFDYLADDFIIRIIELVPEKDVTIKELSKEMFIPNTNKRGFIVLPIDFEGKYNVDPNINDKLNDLNSEYCNVHLQVDAPNGQSLSAVFSEWRPQRNSPIEFDGDSFYILPDLWKRILKTANEFLQQNMKS